VLLTGGSTAWSRPALIAQLAYLIIGGQVLVYPGINTALGRWPSTRVHAWTFLVPAVAVLVEAARARLPGLITIGIVIVILGLRTSTTRARSRQPLTEVQRKGVDRARQEPPDARVSRAKKSERSQS